MADAFNAVDDVVDDVDDTFDGLGIFDLRAEEVEEEEGIGLGMLDWEEDFTTGSLVGCGSLEGCCRPAFCFVGSIGNH